MLTALIRSRTILGFLLTYAMAAVLLIATYLLQLDKLALNDLLFAHWAFGWLEPNAKLIPVICMVLVAVIAIFSRIRFREVQNTLGNTNLTMLMLVSIISTQSKTLLTRPDVLVVALILIALFMLLLSTYKQENALSEMFHTGLLLGLSTLMVGQSIFLLTTVGFSLFILRTGNWREWIVFLLGIVMVAVFVMMVAIWGENPFLGFQRIVQTAWVGSFRTARLTVGHMAIFLVLFLSGSSVFRDITLGTVNERNISLANVSWIAGVILMVLILGLGWQSGLILAAFPLSSFIAKTIEQNSRWWLQDLMLVIVLAAPFLSSLWPL